MTTTTIERSNFSPTTTHREVEPRGDKHLEVISASAWSEGGFGITKYLAVASLTTIASAAFFSVQCPAIATALTAATTWLVFSAAVVAIHRVTEGTLIGRPIRQLYAIVTEANANFIASALFPLTVFKNYHNASGSLTGRPILLINGYMSFGSTWAYQRARLNETGLGPVYTTNVLSLCSIESCAEQLKSKVLQIQKETGRKDITIVGHSKGGLVSTYFATHYAKDVNADVKDVITIGSPFKGTPFACLAIGYDALQMRSGSAFQAELKSSMKEHPEIRFSHIMSEADTTVYAGAATPSRKAPRQFLVKDLGHTSLLFSSRVADQICAWLK